MRTRSSWQIIKSSDISHVAEPFALWSMAEISVGVITGCLPVVPKFFQHIGPEVYKKLSFPFVPASNPGHDPRSNTFKTATNTMIASPFARYSSRPKTSDSENDPRAQIHGEYYMLGEVEASQSRADSDPIPAQDVAVTTERDDLELAIKYPKP